MSLRDHVESLRDQFPALQRKFDGELAVYFDGPAGTQVPTSVIEAMVDYLRNRNANHAGYFATSIESDRDLDEAHQAYADFVGADDGDEIMFGQNMTSLTFSISRAISRTWNAGDEIIVTRLDHDANVTPWVLAAEDRGVRVNYVEFNKTDFTLNLEQFDQYLNEKTKLVAVGCASNATGGINPVKNICDKAKEFGALTYLDAVHFGPHAQIDVKDFGCDFLACSAYKFFGPHTGIVWGKRELLDSLIAYKVRPSSNNLPGKWMTGTQSHESIMGSRAAVDYIADIGRTLASDQSLNRRAALTRAFDGIREYENELAIEMMEKLTAVNGLKIWGITDPSRVSERFPTFSITIDGILTTEIVKRLAAKQIFTWHGNYYALQFTEQNNLEPEGMVRIGLAHYNTSQEIDRLIAALNEIAS